MNPPGDLAQWLGITEESILLQDGLLRLTDLLQVPSAALHQLDKEVRVQQIVSADNKNLSELCSRLESLCRAEHSDTTNLLQYRLTGLKALWRARREISQWEADNGRSVEEAASLTVRQRKSASHSDTATVFSSRLSLLLIFPLIRSQARTDPALCEVTTQLLLQSLRECPPLSLREPVDCLNGLEDLLCSWLGERESSVTAAAALVTLACARNSTKTVLHTVHLLQNTENIPDLPVYDIIYILGALEGGPTVPAALNGSKHMVCWAYHDQLGSEGEGEEAAKRSLATDGTFLYTTNLAGLGLAKLGTGLEGSVRGFVYCKNTELEPGFVAFAGGVLLHRPHSFDKTEGQAGLARVLDTGTLELGEDVMNIPELELDFPGPVTTLSLTSNGMEFYWVRSVNTNTENSPVVASFSHLVVLDVFTVNSQSRTVSGVQERKVLTKREDGWDKVQGLENILQTTRGSGQTGPEPGSQSQVRDPNSTSVGLGYKTLLTCPIITCGSYITIISPPGSNNSPTNQLTRSLFSSGHVMSKTLAVSNTFSVKDGVFNSKTELTEAPHSAFNKGVTLSNMSATFDTFNNCIWTASPDYVDQFFNTGHPAASFTASRLGIDISQEKPATKEDNMASVQEIVSTLIEHTGLMCCHYMSNQLFLSASNILSDKAVDMSHLRRVLQLLERAVVTRDEKSILCQLVVIQFIMKTSSLDKLTECEREIFPNLQALLWRICEAEPGPGEVKNTTREACNTILASLSVLYPSHQAKNDLLLNLLISEQRDPGLDLLKDLMLKKYSQVFFGTKEEDISRKKSLRGDLNLTLQILMNTFDEATEMINKILSLEEAGLRRFVLSLPFISPGLQYVSSLVNSLLADLTLTPRDDPEDDDRQLLCELTDHLLGGCEELLHTVHRQTESLTSDTRQLRLSSIDKVLASSVISHVFLPLVTVLLDPEINTMEMCENNIFKLVQMFDLTCKISQKISQEEDFMWRIKVPTPWAGGKILESCHPVRDNYKYKETISIPGARCLYIKFDPRCSSQYDYDKLTLHAGPSVNCRKIGEYGGNTAGYGSRTVLGGGWPGDVIRVDGDTLTASFEVRSGREHNTPDRVVWGFRLSVRAQEQEDTSCIKPFIADTALSLTQLISSSLEVLYNGVKITRLETECSHLLQSKLLQRCSWERPRKVSGIYHAGDQEIDEDEIIELPRIRISTESLKKMRDLSNVKLPVLRPSIESLIDPARLEECVISAVSKHFSLKEVIHNLSHHESENSAEYFSLIDVMTESYQKLGGLLRILQHIAGLESSWQNEIIEFRENKIKIDEVFFADYGHDESKLKDLTLLSFINDIDFDPQMPQKSVDDLKEKLEQKCNLESGDTREKFPVTKHILEGVMQRLDLLLKVSMPGVGRGDMRPSGGKMSRSLQSWPSTGTRQLKHQSSSCQAWDDSILQIPKLKIKRKLRSDSHNEKLPHSKLLSQLFDFIGSHPEKAVKSSDFIEAARTRKMRGVYRKQAMMIMKDLLKVSVENGSGNYIINSLSFFLQSGPKLSELTCGGLTGQVLDLFGDLLTSTVSLAGQNVFECKTSICLMCTIPFSRQEETALVRSGLVSLLDKLCGLTSLESSDSASQELSVLAWAAFKVLANRCMEWQEDSEAEEDQLQVLRLPHQVSILLTNNLVRAKNASVENSNYEALQEILLLLNNLSESKMGRDILSQPSCVSKLLALLLEPKLSPKMIQTIVQLCHVALPLMTEEAFHQVEVPQWTLGGERLEDRSEDSSRQMVRLILAKVADYLVPGCQVTAMDHKQETLRQTNITENVSPADNDLGEDTLIPGDIPDMDRTMSLFLYKREDETAHDMIQRLLNASSDMRLFRMTESQNMERIVKMDKELNKSNRTEVVTDEATLILRRAIKLAQLGFVVSVGPPQKHDDFTEQKKNAVELIARERNVQLQRHDPVRPFISSSVANNLASDLITLLHTLFSSRTANIWTEAIHDIVSSTIKTLGRVAESKDLLRTESHCSLFSVYSAGRELLAVLATLGGHEESLKPGLVVSILGEGLADCEGEILSLSDSTDQATVRLIVPDHVSHYTRPANILQVPLSRLKTNNKTQPTQLFLPIAAEMIESLQSLLLPDTSGADPLSVPLPSTGDGRSLKLATSRLVAEIRTKASSVLALYLHQPEFACRFLQSSCQAVDMLKCFSKDCQPSDRSQTVVNNTERLRSLYRDSVKPPAPPSRKQNSKNRLMVWDPSRTFPPLKSVLFSHNMSGITFYDDPGSNSGLPRGILAYANQMIPAHVNNFYWEVDILSLGDSPDDSGSVLSVGLAPLAEKKDGSWSNPDGTMFFHNNGRVVHYNGPSLLHWRSLRFDVQLNPGDTLGLGWEKLFEASDNTPASGRVYFTINGAKLDGGLEYVNGNMYPVVHIQKKNVRVKANFGSYKFKFVEGRALQTRALELAAEMKERRDEELSAMPFHSSESSSGSSSPESYDVGGGHRRYNSHSARTAITPKPSREYSPSNTEDFRSELSHGPEAQTGSHIQPVTLLDEDSDEDDEDEDDDDESLHQHDDVNSLLVKSWETKVFPIIRRRFRNETERRDGLDQIKGALSLGMADIARQTVEFLYEENGGIPRDLHLPTVEDIKEELSKFTIERLKKGQAVVISQLDEDNVSALPKYSIPIMMKTFGLTGEVLEIDPTNELVQVETYLKLEGLLVRYWYPITSLEKPSDCSKKTAVTGAQQVNITNFLVHKELLSWEYASTRLNCRRAYINLIEQARDEDLPHYVCVDENSSMATMIKSSILLFRDIDIENLQYISNQSLATPANGNMLERNLNITESGNIFQLMEGRVSNLFYHEAGLLRQELGDAIRKAGRQGEECLIELSNQVCVSLLHAPELFTTEEILINDISTLKSAVHFPGAAFTVASVKISRDIQDWKDLKDLTIQIQTFDGTNVKQNGHITARDVVQYPLEVSGYKDPLYSAFRPVIMAADTVKVSHSGGEDKAAKLVLHSIPAEFPLAMVFIECLVETAQADPEMISGAVTRNVISLITNFLLRHQVAQIVKENILLLLAEIIRLNPSHTSGQSYSLQILQKLQTELMELYETENRRRRERRYPRYSSYLQALFELSVAVTETSGELPLSSSNKSRSPTPSSGEPRESPGLSRSLFGRRMRLYSRRSESPVSVSSNQDLSEVTNISRSWYSSAIKLTEVLRYFVDRKQEDLKKVEDFFRESYQSQLGPNDFARLIVLRGLPGHLTEEQLVTEIQRAVSSHGGLARDDVYIVPVDEVGEAETGARSGVVQVRAACSLEKCRDEIERSDLLSDPALLSVSRVNSSYQAQDPVMELTLKSYLKSKIFCDKEFNLSQDCYNAVEEIFLSCYMASQVISSGEGEVEDVVSLRSSDILRQAEDNMLYTFFCGMSQCGRGLEEGVREVLLQYGHNALPLTNLKTGDSEPVGFVQGFSKESSELAEKSDGSSVEDSSAGLWLRLEGLVRFITDYAKQDVRAVIMGLRSCGFDLFMERVYPASLSCLLGESWSREKDEAVVMVGNLLANRLNTSPLKISPNEIFLSQAELASRELRALQNIPLENIRTHYAFLCSFNAQLEEKLLALVDFRCAGVFRHSLARAVRRARTLIFYQVKSRLWDNFLNASHQRNTDYAPPEIILDPVEEIGNLQHDVCSSLFSQSLSQLAEVQSSQLNVALAAGGDPQYPVNVKMVGEEVLGNSGSFRQFISSMVTQLESSTLNLLVPYKGTGTFSGRYFLKPGSINYGEEKMLQFFGQILGISLRSGTPLALSLMPTFWSSLVNTRLEDWEECRTLDPVTFNYISSIESLTEETFETFLEENDFPKFVFHSLTGEIVELCPGGLDTSLEYHNREEYIQSIKTLKLEEWQSRTRVRHILAGLASLAPISFLQNTFTGPEAELRFCGEAEVNLKFLQEHTIYQVGISPSDPHVTHFWAALQSFTQTERAKFIKFACNQDRIPMTGPRDSTHIPPYPMKLAPPDQKEGEPDLQLIRVETCMFLVKLPRYSSYQIMRDKLLYALSCALDPLSG